VAFQASPGVGLSERFAGLTSPSDVLFVVNSTPRGTKMDVADFYQIEGIPFTLTSFVAQVGANFEGHALAFVRAESGGWFCADDDVVFGHTDFVVGGIFAGSYPLVRPVILCFSRNWLTPRGFADDENVPDPDDWAESMQPILPRAGRASRRFGEDGVAETSVVTKRPARRRKRAVLRDLPPSDEDSDLHSCESWDSVRLSALWDNGRVEDWETLFHRFPEFEEHELRSLFDRERLRRWAGGNECTEEELAALEEWLDADGRRPSMKELALNLGDRWPVSDVRSWTMRIRCQRRREQVPTVPHVSSGETDGPAA
jgi:hypothetical protein